MTEGIRLGAGQLALAAALHEARLPVYRRLKVALLSSGAEPSTNRIWSRPAPAGSKNPGSPPAARALRNASASTLESKVSGHVVEMEPNTATTA